MLNLQLLAISHSGKEKKRSTHVREALNARDKSHISKALLATKAALLHFTLRTNEKSFAANFFLCLSFLNTFIFRRQFSHICAQVTPLEKGEKSKIWVLGGGKTNLLNRNFGLGRGIRISCPPPFTSMSFH